MNILVFARVTITALSRCPLQQFRNACLCAPWIHNSFRENAVYARILYSQPRDAPVETSFAMTCAWACENFRAPPAYKKKKKLILPRKNKNESYIYRFSYPKTQSLITWRLNAGTTPDDVWRRFHRDRSTITHHLRRKPHTSGRTRVIRY